MERTVAGSDPADGVEVAPTPSPQPDPDDTPASMFAGTTISLDTIIELAEPVDRLVSYYLKMAPEKIAATVRSARICSILAICHHLQGAMKGKKRMALLDKLDILCKQVDAPFEELVATIDAQQQQRELVGAGDDDVAAGGLSERDIRDLAGSAARG